MRIRWAYCRLFLPLTLSFSPLSRNILLAAALDLESDLFWSALTALGFRSYLAPRTAAIKILIRKDDPLPKDEGDVVAAIRRAVVVAKVKTRGTKRKAVVAEDESE